MSRSSGRFLAACGSGTSSRHRSVGFSLIELVIAISLASFVLVGVASIAAQMARTQIEGIRSGTATGWSLVSYLAMSKEIEDSNVLAYPTPDLMSADAIIVCKNWSRMQDPNPPGDRRLDRNVPGTVSVIQYCVDPAAPVAPETGFRLRRFAKVGVPPAVVCPDPGVLVACTATPPGGWTETGVVGFRLEKLAGFPLIFQRDNSIGGVRLRYAIGRQTPTTNDPNPKSTHFDIAIAMQKQYNNPLD